MKETYFCITRQPNELFMTGLEIDNRATMISCSGIGRVKLQRRQRRMLYSESEDEWVTPPITAGLLGGTFRADLLAKKIIREGLVTIADLELVEEIQLINSVRKWRKAWLVSQPVSVLES